MHAQNEYIKAFFLQLHGELNKLEFLKNDLTIANQTLQREQQTINNYNNITQDMIDANFNTQFTLCNSENILKDTNFILNERDKCYTNNANLNEEKVETNDTIVNTNHNTGQSMQYDFLWFFFVSFTNN